MELNPLSWLRKYGAYLDLVLRTTAACNVVLAVRCQTHGADPIGGRCNHIVTLKCYHCYDYSSRAFGQALLYLEVQIVTGNASVELTKCPTTQTFSAQNRDRHSGLLCQADASVSYSGTAIHRPSFREDCRLCS